MKKNARSAFAAYGNTEQVPFISVEWIKTMKQRSFASVGLSGLNFGAFGRTTRKAKFLIEMNALMPWSAACELIEPHYRKVGNGRPPIGLERMLRIHFLQLWRILVNPSG